MTDLMMPWAPFRVVLDGFVGDKSTINMSRATRELTYLGLAPMTALQHVKASNTTTYAIEKMMEKIK